jgi:hypothetical protein
VSDAAATPKYKWLDSDDELQGKDDLLELKDEVIAHKDRIIGHYCRMLNEALAENRKLRAGTDGVSCLRREAETAEQRVKDLKHKTMLHKQLAADFQTLQDRYDTIADVPIDDPILMMIAIRRYRAEKKLRCWRQFPNRHELVTIMAQHPQITVAEQKSE